MFVVLLPGGIRAAEHQSLSHPRRAAGAPSRTGGPHPAGEAHLHVMRSRAAGLHLVLLLLTFTSHLGSSLESSAQAIDTLNGSNLTQSNDSPMANTTDMAGTAVSGEASERLPRSHSFVKSFSTLDPHSTAHLISTFKVTNILLLHQIILRSLFEIRDLKPCKLREDCSRDASGMYLVGRQDGEEIVGIPVLVWPQTATSTALVTNKIVDSFMLMRTTFDGNQVDARPPLTVLGETSAYLAFNFITLLWPLRTKMEALLMTSYIISLGGFTHWVMHMGQDTAWILIMLLVSLALQSWSTEYWEDVLGLAVCGPPPTEYDACVPRSDFHKCTESHHGTGGHKALVDQPSVDTLVWPTSSQWSACFKGTEHNYSVVQEIDHCLKVSKIVTTCSVDDNPDIMQRWRQNPPFWFFAHYAGVFLGWIGVWRIGAGENHRVAAEPYPNPSPNPSPNPKMLSGL